LTIFSFTPHNLRGWGISVQPFSGVRGPNIAKLGVDIGRSFLHKFVSEFGYLAAFSNASDSKLSDVKYDAKFCTL